MHPATTGLAELLRSTPRASDRLDLLHGRYSGQPCVVVTCGPSLSRLEASRLREGLAGVLTIVVKQAIDVVGPEADFHCWNSFNVTKFVVPSGETVRCYVEEGSGRVSQFNGFDLKFEQMDAGGDLGRSIAARRDFGDHLLGNGAPRPFGPGIMFELVIHLAVHLGVSEIITVGWDIGDSDGKNTHYYDDSDARSYFERGRPVGAGRAAAPSGSRIPDPLRVQLRRGRSFVAHQRRQLYNKTTPLRGETDMVSASTLDLREWLAGTGIGLVVATDSPFIDSNIPRLSHDDLFERLDQLRP